MVCDRQILLMLALTAVVVFMPPPHLGGAEIKPGTAEKTLKNGGTMKISEHNCQREVELTPELIERFGLKQYILESNGVSLPYCEKVICPELPGKPLLVIFLHGVGSRGNDNFLQTRIPTEPLIRFFEAQKRKTVLLMPQCAEENRWTRVSGHAATGAAGEALPFMAAVLELLDKKTAEYQPEQRAALGLSMGGHGVWDLVCRREFDIIGVMCGRGDPAQAHRFVDKKVCIYHGDSDTIVPTERGRAMFEALKKAGCRKLRYKELKNTKHNAWDPFLFDGEALPFLFNDDRNDAERK